METIWKTVFRKLKENGINVYPPATKIGECKTEYVVIKQDGSSQVGSFSSEFVYYHFMLYVPANRYSYLSEYEKKVKDIINKELYPLLVPTDSNMADYFDDEVKAHMRSFIYRNSVRNRHL